MSYFREEYTEAWDNAHDPQRATPTAYCPVCGGAENCGERRK